MLWVDLAGQFRRARKPAPPQAERRELESKGEARDAIFQHAAAPGQALSEIVFPPLRFPALGDGVDGIALRTAIGFKDGEAFVDAKSDGCEFIVLANDEEVFRETYARQEWRQQSIDLTRFAGREVVLKFLIAPRKHSAADWAAWAEPALWLTGDEDAVRQQLRTASGLPPHWPLAELRDQLETPSRVFRRDDHLHIAVMDEHLDLATATERLAAEVGAPLVPLAPRIVVGEGAHPDNHTLVKVLGDYGIAEVQFLAFPPDVRGGVWVEAVGDGIAATPISSKVSEVRFFDASGGLKRVVKLGIDPPFVMAAADFREDSDGEELIVASEQGGESCIFNQDGKEIGRWMIPMGKTHLASRGTSLLTYTDDLRALLVNNFRHQAPNEELKMDFLPAGRRVFETAFDDGRLWAGGEQPLRSHVYEIKSDGSYVGKDVGQEENQFWIGLPKEFEQEIGVFEGKAEAKHIRLASYGHIRVDSLSPRYRNPDAGPWAGKPVVAALGARGFLKPLSAQPLRMWNPTATHRQFPQPFRPWAEQVDERSGANRYLQQSPEGASDGYGQWDQPILLSSTYAPGATELQKLYTEPLRAFLRHWAPRFREQPWLAPSIEPNHEFESVVATHQGVGDYNPHMIRGFFQWLVRHYGDDQDAWEKRFGVRFEEFFDAPRGLGRGPWDRYGVENPWLLAWVEYNRHVINRMLALSYREALLAGLPPELIRSHQIPDRYAVGPLLSGITRITPIDYAMTAGVGFGFTKFGTNFDKEDNVIAATRSSGFDSFVMGEFQPLKTDPEPVEKELRYVFGNGAKAIHPLYWGSTHTKKDANADDQLKNKTLHAALQALILEDPPRPGQAGGIGQVRAFRDGKRRFNVVSVGTGAGHRGLLKSVRADGKMEGTVYAVPFHQHVHVKPLKTERGRIEIIGAMAPGSQVEMRAGSSAATMVKVLRGGVELADLRANFAAGDWHFILRLPERCDDLSLVFESDAEIERIEATLQSPQAADVHVGRRTGVAHRGGITFDLLD